MLVLKSLRGLGLAGMVVGLVGYRAELRAAIPGAWETFETEAHAAAWSVLDEADGKFYQVEWIESADGNPYVAAVHDGDFPLTFVAGPEVGAGALEGDFNAANVAAISSDIYIDDLDEFDAVDCSVVANGPAGLRVYYSYAFLAEDFTGEGWWTVNFSFDDEWFYADGEDWIAVTVDETFLASISDLGIGFYPRVGSTVDSVAAIDNVVLEPRVIAPELEFETVGAAFQISFTPAPGLLAAVERLGPAPALGWGEVVADVTGPAAYTFSTPIDAPSKIFRVRTEPGYEVIAAPAP